MSSCLTHVIFTSTTLNHVISLYREEKVTEEKSTISKRRKISWEYFKQKISSARKKQKRKHFLTVIMCLFKALPVNVMTL